jgi:phosphatidylglycerophosphate synthase
MPSSISGKLTVLFQTITIFLFIFKLQKAGILISYFMVAITIFSTIHYIFLGVEKIKELK